MSKAGGTAGRSRAGRLFSERRRVDAGGASRFLADPAGVRADVAADEEAEATAAELTAATSPRGGAEARAWRCRGLP